MENRNAYYTQNEIIEALRIKTSALEMFYNEYSKILIDKYTEIIIKKSK